jgi:hypothetical protein
MKRHRVVGVLLLHRVEQRRDPPPVAHRTTARERRGAGGALAVLVEVAFMAKMRGGRVRALLLIRGMRRKVRLRHRRVPLRGYVPRGYLSAMPTSNRRIHDRLSEQTFDHDRLGMFLWEIENQR